MRCSNDMLCSPLQPKHADVGVPKIRAIRCHMQAMNRMLQMLLPQTCENRYRLLVPIADTTGTAPLRVNPRALFASSPLVWDVNSAPALHDSEKEGRAARLRCQTSHRKSSRRGLARTYARGSLDGEF